LENKISCQIDSTGLERVQQGTCTEYGDEVSCSINARNS
jgi:hypothetical protein